MTYQLPDSQIRSLSVRGTTVIDKDRNFKGKDINIRTINGKPYPPSLIVSTATFSDTAFSVLNATDNTVALKLDVSGTTGTSMTLLTSQTSNKVLTLPDVTDVLISRTTTDSLMNKSLTDASNNVTARSLWNGSGTGSVSTFASDAPVTGQILVATTPTTATWQSLSSVFTTATFVDSTFAIYDATDNTKSINFNASGTTGTSTTLLSSQTTNKVLTLPDTTDTLIAKSTTDTLTNKTLTANSNNITARALWVGSGTGSVSTYASAAPVTGQILVATAPGTATWQTLSAITPSTTDTMLNKTLTDNTNNVTSRALWVGSGTGSVSTYASAAPVTGQILVATAPGTATWQTLSAITPSTTDTLLNKTLTDNTNNVTSRALWVGSGTGSVSTYASAAPVTGQILVATTPGTATWQTLSVITPSTTDTLLNKTLTANSNNVTARALWVGSGTGSVSTYAAAAPVTGQILVATAPGTATWQTLSSISPTTFVDTTFCVYDIIDNTKAIKLNAAGTTGTNTTLLSSQTTNKVLTLPDASDTLIAKATTDTLLNKTITDNTNNVTSRALWVGSGTGCVSTYAAAAPVTGQILVATAPGTATWQTLAIVTSSTTDTLLNKTLTNNSNNVTARALWVGSGTGSVSTYAASAPVTGQILVATAPGTATWQTLSSISPTTFVDTTFCVYDIIDNTKAIKLDAAGTTGTSTTLLSSQTTNKVLTLPNATDTLVAKATTDTLTNKTLTDNTNNVTSRALWVGSGTGSVSTYAAAAPVTGQILVATAPGTATWQTLSIVTSSTTDTLLNKTLTDNTNNVTARALWVGTGTGSVSTYAAAAPVTGQILVATAPGTATWQTLSSISPTTFVDTTFCVYDVTDNTKAIKLDAAGTTGTSTTLLSSQTTNKVLTLPNATDTLVAKATTDTLLNKTITDNTNNVTSRALWVGSGTGCVSTYAASAPITGQLLVATAPGTATWQSLAIVTPSTTDTLLNKTLTNNSNNVIARALWIGSGTGSVSTYAAAAPVTGQILVATSPGTATWQTLSTMSPTTFADTTFCVYDIIDNTKAIKLDAAGTTGTSTTLLSSQTTNKVLTLPNATDTLVAKATTDTLLNKTITDNTNNVTSRALWVGSGTGCVSTYAAAAPVTGQILVATAPGTATWQTLSTMSPTTFADTTFCVYDIIDNTKAIKLNAAGTTGTTTTLLSSQTTNKVLTLPDATDTLVAKATTDTLLNKTITDNTNNVTSRALWVGSGTGCVSTYAAAAPVTGQVLVATAPGTATWQTLSTMSATTFVDTTFAVYDVTDNTISIKLDAAGTTGTSTTLLSSQTTNKVLTLPDITDILVSRTTTDTLTNKTLTNNTNNILARGLWNGTGTGSVSTYSAAAPVTGQILSATSSSTATWQNFPVVLDPAATPTYPTSPQTEGIWYGQNAKANCLNASSIAIGNGAVGGAAIGIAIGSATANNIGIAIGYSVTATSPTDSSICIGRLSAATGANSIAMGLQTGANNVSGLAIGNLSSCQGFRSSIFGYQCFAGGSSGFNFAAGFQCSVTGNSATAIGSSSTASAANAVAVGNGCVANVTNSIALGNGATVSGSYCLSLGLNSSSFGEYYLNLRVGNVNRQIDLYNSIYTTTVTTGGDTQLTSLGSKHYYFTGTNTQNCILPPSNTGQLIAWVAKIVNNSTGAVSVWADAAKTILVATLPGAIPSVSRGGWGFFNCVDHSVIAASSWSVELGVSSSLSPTTFVDTTFAVYDVTDNTKAIKLDASGTTGTSTTLLSSQTTNKVLTLPDATDTLIARTTTDTLTNKTLTNNTNNILARGLWNGNGTGSVSTYAAAAPTTGQILVATAPDTATWQNFPVVLDNLATGTLYPTAPQTEEVWYGSGTKANTGPFGTTIGNSATSGDSGVSIGNGAKSGQNATAVGSYTTASGFQSVSIGQSAFTNSTAAVVVGAYSSAATQSVCVGQASNAAAQGIAIGYTTFALAASSVVIGNNITNSVSGSVLLGTNGVRLARFDTLGTVTQLTSLTTGVTIDSAQGKITLFSALPATMKTRFTVTNNRVQATSVINVTSESEGSTDGFPSVVGIMAITAGTFDVIVYNSDTGDTTAAPVIHFTILYPAV